MKPDKFQNKYRIPSARAVWHDYNGGDYFITICTSNRTHYFGEVCDGIMVFNDTGHKINELIQHIEQHHCYAHLGTYQVMPNHVHLIAGIDDNKRVVPDTPENVQMENAGTKNIQTVGRVETGHVPSLQLNQLDQTSIQEKMKLISEQKGLLSVAMGNLKSAMTKYCNDHHIDFGWQERFHDHVIRDWDEYCRIANYIENNPLLWKDDNFYTE